MNLNIILFGLLCVLILLIIGLIVSFILRKEVMYLNNLLRAARWIWGDKGRKSFVLGVLIGAFLETPFVKTYVIDIWELLATICTTILAIAFILYVIKAKKELFSGLKRFFNFLFKYGVFFVSMFAALYYAEIYHFIW